MPWTSHSFAVKHNKKLEKSPAKAKKASKVANAILDEGGSEGKAIRIANWIAKRNKKKKGKE